jgi:hypothetical protein
VMDSELVARLRAVIHKLARVLNDTSIGADLAPRFPRPGFPSRSPSNARPENPTPSVKRPGLKGSDTWDLR